MRAAWLFLASVFLLWSPGARALTCAKATTLDEKAICGDPALKAQDAALSGFYFETLRGLTGGRHALLIADQRRWLEEDRGSTCAPSDKPSARVPCLAASLAARRRALAICFAGAQDGAPELGGKPIGGADICTLVYHPGCPKITATASARLAAYPWILQKFLTATKNTDDGDCGPESADSPGTPDQNETSSAATILAERPNLVSVRYETDSMFRGAAHPSHDERIVSYDTRTKAEIPVTALMPKLKTGSSLLAAIDKAADGKLDVPCCGDDTDHTFSGIGHDGDGPMPGGWAVSAAGDLILAYDYNAMARDFVATAIIPRRLFIDAVDPRYAAVFVKDPLGK